MVEDPTLPTNLDEAAAALAESVHRDACSLCLSPDKLNEIISGAVNAVRDPMGAVAKRIQSLVGEEYDQWVASVPIRKSKASRSGSERAGAGSSSNRGSRFRGFDRSGGHRPPSKQMLRHSPENVQKEPVTLRKDGPARRLGQGEADTLEQASFPQQWKMRIWQL